MDESAGPGAWIVGFLACVALIFVVIAGGAWLLSFHGVDAGEICVVKEGGPFDGRDVKEVRQPGSGVKPIGAFNGNHCLPVTERDSNDVIEEDPTFPTRDAVQVIADGQVLFNLTTDPDKIEAFYKRYARRKWGGEDIWSDNGWINFLRERFQPVVLDTMRQTIGEYECTQLNNLCQYVQNAEAVSKGEVEKVDNSQNLSAAATKIAENLNDRLNAAFSDPSCAPECDFFENIRYQNLKIRFEDEVQQQITEAQSLRTQAANAKLEADRVKAEAVGRTRVAREQAKQIRLKARSYRNNPSQAKIDLARAICGDTGCTSLQVLGGGNITKLVGQP